MNVQKQSARLVVVRHSIPRTLEIAQVFSKKPAFITSNGCKGVLVFNDIEMDPIWLLDLRRAGIPYVWMWGTEANSWRYAEATRLDFGGRIHTVVDLRSNKAGNATDLQNAIKAAQDFVFEDHLIDHSYDLAHEAKLSLGTPLMA